jgi:hypothetical protein
VNLGKAHRDWCSRVEQCDEAALPHLDQYVPDFNGTYPS